MTENLTYFVNEHELCAVRFLAVLAVPTSL